MNRKIPLHIRIKKLHIPLFKHARINLIPLRKNSPKHHMYQFTAIRSIWLKSNKRFPSGPYGNVLIKGICYRNKLMTNHMWVYGNKNLRDILPMSRGTHFSFRGWVAKYLKCKNNYYDYRINHIRDVKVIKYKK